VDETVNRFGPGRVRALSIAAGHLRELELAQRIVDCEHDQLIALDQDMRSVKEVGEAYGRFRVRAMHASVADVLNGSVRLDKLHLVYAAGLLDYLKDDVAARLIRSCLEMLAPGGRLVVANFAPDLPDVGYMEAMMDWWLIYRDESDLRALASAAAKAGLTGESLYRDTTGRIVFLEIEKA
jgi:SAM-dependent methyltransferase